MRLVYTFINPVSLSMEFEYPTSHTGVKFSTFRTTYTAHFDIILFNRFVYKIMRRDDYAFRPAEYWAVWLVPDWGL